MLRFCISGQCSLSQTKYSPLCGCRLLYKCHHRLRDWSQKPHYSLDISFSSFPLPCIICHSAHPLILISYNQVLPILSAVSWIHPQPWPHADHCHLSSDGLHQQHSPSPLRPALSPSWAPCFCLPIVNPISAPQRGWLTSSYKQVLACSGPRDVSRSLWSGVSREAMIFLIKKGWPQVAQRHLSLFPIFVWHTDWWLEKEESSWHQGDECYKSVWWSRKLQKACFSWWLPGTAAVT